MDSNWFKIDVHVSFVLLYCKTTVAYVYAHGQLSLCFYISVRYFAVLDIHLWKQNTLIRPPLYSDHFFMKNRCCNILRWNVTILTMRIDTKIHFQSTLVEICFHISCLRKPYLQEQSFPANLACRYGACGPFVDLRSKQECNY